MRGKIEEGRIAENMDESPKKGTPAYIRYLLKFRDFHRRGRSIILIDEKVYIIRPAKGEYSTDMIANEMKA